jgi:hypothetical protein
MWMKSKPHARSKRVGRSAGAAAAGLAALMYSASAHAYLDPGSGSMMLQGLIAALAIAGSGISVFWGKIRSIFGRSKPQDDGAEAAPRKTRGLESKDR